ncbi:Cyclopropane fatty-acyl-phospholipid synthase [Thermomonospora echinospora]|uniref:Cyclopropane fatty-acyl-phospholipid synthase n=1 Tax=Thermomonospora echinospora TaxID=1992 RepID=A0A1H5TS77_9ACTN|nr:methyltransferase domain-containing protein [Thermomonospora echinospora]SEF65644.1 Cyclopropane fatty-acyl-phospholipid synthase [Thermomonospora echinospora]
MTSTRTPQQEDVADFYEQSTLFLAELTGGSLHFGYWTAPSDEAPMEVASRQLTDLMIEKIAVRPGDRVLDIGCGTGGPAVRLARETGATVVGVTISAVQVEKARALAESSGLGDRVTFQQADAMDLPFPTESFDAVWLFESIFHMPDRIGPLRQAAAVLRPGGRLALTDVLTSPAHDVPDKPYSSLFGEPIQLHDYPPLLERAGLTPVETTDITEQSVGRTLDRIEEKITADRARFVERFGAELVDQVASTVPMLRAVRLGYALVTATR